MSIELLKIAKQDLKAAEVLYEKGLYSQSLFSFQQSIEKANKAIILSLEGLTPNQVRKARHSHLKLSKKMLLLQEKQIANNNEFLREMPLPQLINSLIKSHENLKKDIEVFSTLTEEDFSNPTGKDIDDLIKSINEIQKLNFKIPSNLEVFVENKLTIITNWIGTFGTEEAITFKEEFLEYMRDESNKKEFVIILEEILTGLIDFLKAYIPIYSIGLFTSPHSVSTRYTDGKNGNTPLVIYNRRMPLIKKQGILMKISSKALNKLNRLLLL